MIIIFYIIVLIFSVIIHEISHGYVALWLGDETAKRAGRLTLNPIAHIDIFGSILLPLMMVLLGGPVFGWAKPVPYDPRFLKNPKRAAGLIALAGPAANFLLALIFAILVRTTVGFTDNLQVLQLFYFFNIIVQINVALAIFNLIPIPPLDGSGILFMLLPLELAHFETFLRKYGFYILLILILTGLQFLSPFIINTHLFLVGSKAAGLLM